MRAWCKGEIIRLGGNDDPFTGIDQEEMGTRKQGINYDVIARARILIHTLLEGDGSEQSAAAMVAKVSPKKFKQKRIGEVNNVMEKVRTLK